MSMNSLENLSNEFFSEIFDYINGCDIYRAFSNLNYRFEQLLNSSHILFKIKINYSTDDEKTMNELQQVWMDATDSNMNISLPMASNHELTSIEHLIIDHPCCFNQLNNILSYVPQVSYLKFFSVNDNEIDMKNISSMRLSYLTYFYIEAYHMEFDTFEMLIKNLNIKLKYFSLKIYTDDMNYLHAFRWENLLLKHLPNLEEFYLKSITTFENNHQPSIYQGKINEFFSSFWCQRQWILEINIDSNEIIYYIHSHKKRWYEFNIEEKNNSTIEQLEKCEILFSLPHLDSLKLNTISTSYPRCLTEEELIQSYCLISRNKITKVCLQKIDRIEEAYFILALCSHIEQLRINSLKDINVELFLRSFFIEIQRREIPTLKLLCICVPTADDKMMKKLETMIKNENLLWNFTMKRLMDQIYIQWK
ncbi:unnamed protein product [Adineta steineri]|uniref:F-box domain-containing protein n=1 Tax=Adineta steineri TaxID=433720 RepID=A0A819BZK9_9BILA|nr:unnamed protein product [Adineta steineri]